jgi:uncharacterized protein YggU (UPF0235/DUF167 family)
VKLRVRLTPKSAGDTVEGIEDSPLGPVLRVRVRAAPERGAANAMLEKTVSRWLNVQKGAVAVVAGEKSRLKTLFVAGDPIELSQAMGAAFERALQGCEGARR